METAKDILENHGITEKSTDSYFYERALKSMREITELTYDQFNPLIVMDCGCDVCKMNQRKKYTFMKSLFPQ